MFREIAGQFDRHFISGHLLPSLFFILLNLVLDYTGILSLKLITLLSPLGLTWGIPLVLTAAMFGGILLSALNRPIIMFYEGYPLQKLRVFRFLTTRQRRQWYKLNNRLNQLKEQYYALERNQEDQRIKALESEITLLQWRANNLFPPEAESVLPTRLGNAIRAFETYATERYGIDPVILWSRLTPILPDEFSGTVLYVISSFNCLINLVLTMHVIGLELLTLPPYQDFRWRLLGAFVSFIISYCLYRAAISRAIDWGYVFNTAFDLYRRDLLKKLGFRPPKDLEKERKLWGKIWDLILYKHTEDIVFNLEIFEKEEEN